MGWIKVEDSLPADYEEKLLYCHGGTYLGHYQVHNGGTDGKKAGSWYKYSDHEDDPRIFPTHWMDTPRPPK